MEPVGTDDQVGTDLGAVGERQHTVGDALDLSAQHEPIAAQPVDQRLMQRSAMEPDKWLPIAFDEHGRVELGERRTIRAPQGTATLGDARRVHQGVQPESAERVHAVGPDRKAGAKRADLFGAFIDGCVHARPLQSDTAARPPMPPPTTAAVLFIAILFLLK